jgi:fatty acid desaturase
VGKTGEFHLRKSDALLLTIAATVVALQFGLFPLLFHPTLLGASAFVVLVAATEPLHYGLMHETIHGNLVRNEVWNRRLGRALGVALGLPWETMRFGHLAHHGFNRHDFDRPEALAPGQPRVRAAAVYYFKLVFGNALAYALAPLLLLLPASTTERVVWALDSSEETAPLRAAALRAFTNPARRNGARVDLALIVAADAGALWLWGAWWPVFAATVIARWALLSLLDNAPHYGMPLDSGLDARNTRIPRWAAWLVLNQNYHGIHHHNPQMRWQELPGEFARSSNGYDGGWTSSLLRQFRGPVELS